MALFLALGSLLAQTATEDKAIEAKKLYNEGISALRTGKTDVALNKLNEAVQKDPDLAVAYYGLGIAYKLKRDYVNAMKNYQTAIDKDPQLVKAYTALGLLQLQQQEYVKAINTFKAAVKIKPDEVKAIWGIADAYRRKRDYRTALEYYQKAVMTDETYAKAWDGLGATLYELGKYADAVDAFNTALKNQKKNKEKEGTLLRLGNAYVKLKNYTAAEKAYKDCLAIVRSSNIRAAANFGLGEIYRDRGKKKLALTYFQKASKNRNWQQPALYEIDLIKNGDKYTN
ncbi:MAG: tetratricopeptide repeat protein [Calditrichia bacterium]